MKNHSIIRLIPYKPVGIIIEITFTYTEEDWSPYLSLEEAEKLDNLRIALQENDLKTATQLAHVYQLTPVVVSA